MKTEHIVGSSSPRKEGRDKVTGQARYIDDISMPRMIYGATVRSQDPSRQDQKNNIWAGNRVERFRRSCPPRIFREKITSR